MSIPASASAVCTQCARSARTWPMYTTCLASWLTPSPPLPLYDPVGLPLESGVWARHVTVTHKGCNPPLPCTTPWVVPRRYDVGCALERSLIPTTPLPTAPGGGARLRSRVQCGGYGKPEAQDAPFGNDSAHTFPYQDERKRGRNGSVHRMPKTNPAQPNATRSVSCLVQLTDKQQGCANDMADKRQEPSNLLQKHVLCSTKALQACNLPAEIFNLPIKPCNNP